MTSPLTTGREKRVSMGGVATAMLMLLSILIMALYLPMLYGKLFFDPVEKTHLFYSPVTERFIYTEKIVGPIPPEALATAEDHHVELSYRDQDGTWYTRVAFEKHLPFIYYKNMELWGMLPLMIRGEIFDKKTIKKNRRVLSLKQHDIIGSRPRVPFWPLLESNPGQARLIFPDDRFRMTKDRMVFVNADTNSVDEILTSRFTNALKGEGFRFPARSVNGKFTILKPFDEGVFLVDATDHVFHLKRVNNEPVVVRTDIDPALKTRYIKVSENRRREYYGMLLSDAGTLHLIRYDDYALVDLPLKYYDFTTMDMKLIINPLYCTAVYSDEAVIHAVAMDRNYHPIATYQHTMSRAHHTAAKSLYAALFPFCFELKNIDGKGYIGISFSMGGRLALIGIGVGLLFITLWNYGRYRRFPGKLELCLTALTGVYGVITLLFVRLKS